MFRMRKLLHLLIGLVIKILILMEQLPKSLTSFWLRELRLGILQEKKSEISKDDVFTLIINSSQSHFEDFIGYLWEGQILIILIMFYHSICGSYFCAGCPKKTCVIGACQISLPTNMLEGWKIFICIVSSVWNTKTYM